MKLDSIGAIAEIAVYYGELDDIYRLMKRLNRKTNKMWNNIWAELSKIITRKFSKTLWKSWKEVINGYNKNPFILTLFTLKWIDVSNKEDYKKLIDLFEEFKYPKMIKMHLSLSLAKDKDTLITFSNYREYMKQKEHANIALFNKLVQTAINREIDLSLLHSYAFINEIKDLKDIQYIKYIVFPWNEENDADSMIKVWEEFAEAKMFDYFSVRLIWDGMKLKEFLKIYKILAKENIRIEIVSKFNLNNLSLFLEEVSWWNNNSYFKMGIDNEYILWGWNRGTSTIKLRKWYCKPDKSLKCFIGISNWIIKHNNENVMNDSEYLEINLENLASIDFKFDNICKVKRRDEKLINLIKFQDKNIQISTTSIRNWELRRNKIEKWVFILNEKMKVESDQFFKINCSFKVNKIKNLKISSFKHNEKDSNKNKKNDWGYIYSISALADNFSSGISFINYWENLLSLKVIALKIRQKCSEDEKYQIEEEMNRIKRNGLRVKLVYLNHD